MGNRNTIMTFMVNRVHALLSDALRVQSLSNDKAYLKLVTLRLKLLYHICVTCSKEKLNDTRRQQSQHNECSDRLAGVCSNLFHCNIRVLMQIRIRNVACRET